MKLNFNFIRNLPKRTLLMAVLIAAVMAIGIAGFFVAKKQEWIVPKADVVAGRVTWAGASNELQPNFTQLQRTVVSNSVISLASTSNQDFDAGSINISLAGLTTGQTGTMEIPITNSAVILRINQCKQSNGTCYFGVYRQTELGTSRLKINFSTITLANSNTTVSTANYKSAIRSERDPGNAYSYTYEAADSSHYTYNLNAETSRLTRSRPFFSFNTFNSTVSTPIIRLNYAVEYVAVGDTPSFQLNLRSLSQGWQGFTPLDYWNKITVGGAGGYESNGTATIPSFNASSSNSSTSWQTISWANTGSTNTSVSARVKAASTSSGLASAQWSSPVTTSGGRISGTTALTGQYVAVELTLSTTNTSETPMVTSVTINGSTTPPPPSNPNGPFRIAVTINGQGATATPALQENIPLNSPSQNIQITITNQNYLIDHVTEQIDNNNTTPFQLTPDLKIPGQAQVQHDYFYNVYMIEDPRTKIRLETNASSINEETDGHSSVAQIKFVSNRPLTCRVDIAFQVTNPNPPTPPATSGTDYFVNPNYQPSIIAGLTSVLLPVNIIPDQISEGNEALVVNLIGLTNTCGVIIDPDPTHRVHTLTIIDNDNQFTITASAGANGSISPSGTNTYQGGSSAAYAITPTSGYYIRSVKLKNTDTNQESYWDEPLDNAPNYAKTYTFSNIQNNWEIRAEFLQISTKVWTGRKDTSWDNGPNWTGNTVPNGEINNSFTPAKPIQHVFFKPNSTTDPDVTLRDVANAHGKVGALAIFQGYTKTITATDNLTLRGQFIQRAGTFNAPGTGKQMIIYINFDRTGGTFNHRQGVVYFMINQNLFIKSTPNGTFFNLVFDRNGGSLENPIAALASNLVVAGNIYVKQDGRGYTIGGSGVTVGLAGTLIFQAPGKGASGNVYFGPQSGSTFNISIVNHIWNGNPDPNYTNYPQGNPNAKIGANVTFINPAGKTNTSDIRLGANVSQLEFLNNFSSNAPGKTIAFEAGKFFGIGGAFNIQGLSFQQITLTSTSNICPLEEKQRCTVTLPDNAGDIPLDSCTQWALRTPAKNATIKNALIHSSYFIPYDVNGNGTIEEPNESPIIAEYSKDEKGNSNWLIFNGAKPNFANYLSMVNRSIANVAIRLLAQNP